MAQKYADIATANVNDRLDSVAQGAIHLSDGTLVYLVYDGTGNLSLKYSSDHTTLNTIATISSTTFSIPATAGVPLVSLARDSLDNLYVVGVNSANTQLIAVQAFVKGAGYTWTQKTALTGDIAGSSAIGSASVVWCNTGGGTNSKGHLMVIGSSVSGGGYYGVCDAGAALAGSGTLLISSALSFQTAASNILIHDLQNDGFGATSGIVALATAGTTYCVGAWAVNSSGVLTVNSALSATVTVTSFSKIRVIRTASNVWAIVCNGTTSTHYSVARYSASAQLTAPTDSGTPTSMPLVGSGNKWDAAMDPAGNKIWIYAVGTLSGSNLPIYRLGVSVSGTPSFDAAATLDDTFTGVTSASASELRTVSQSINGRIDYQVHVQTSATPTYALYGDNTSFNSTPNVPTNLSRQAPNTDTTPVFQADISDPDTSQQIKARFQIYQNDGVTLIGSVDSAFNTGAGTVTAEYASALAVGTYKVQVATVDDLGVISAYTSQVTFTVTQTVTKDETLKWNVAALLTKDETLLWGVLVNNQKDVSLVWGVRVNVPPKDLTLLWDVEPAWVDVPYETLAPTWQDVHV